MRSNVRDVKVQLIDDRVKAYVVFDVHGKDMTLQLEGRLGAQNGYLRFEPLSGEIGSLPIPQSTLESAVQRLMDSPENREKLKLPSGCTLGNRRRAGLTRAEHSCGHHSKSFHEHHQAHGSPRRGHRPPALWCSR